MELATETRDNAYRMIIDQLVGRQQLVYAVIISLRKVFGIWPTNNEISRELGIPINMVTPRVFELRGKGLLEAAGTRVCGVSGRICQTWKATGL